MIPSVAQLAGVWKRDLNYEPRETVADSAERDGSLVFWAQSPCGAFIDVRNIKSEGFRVRGFAGKAVVEESSTDPTSFSVTWHRHVDTMPESCSSGIDSATCRLVGGNIEDETANVVLLEEGDGYLEIWTRVRRWTSSDHTTLHASHKEMNNFEIAFSNTATFRVYPGTVSLEGFDHVHLDSSKHSNC
ncbi:Septum formation protein Maf [Diplonema papillatum]|nr:Septum formation protein Maf [Diplonema papillatum]